MERWRRMRKDTAGNTLSLWVVTETNRDSVYGGRLTGLQRPWCIEADWEMDRLTDHSAGGHSGARWESMSAGCLFWGVRSCFRSTCSVQAISSRLYSGRSVQLQIKFHIMASSLAVCWMSFTSSPHKLTFVLICLLCLCHSAHAVAVLLLCLSWTKWPCRLAALLSWEQRAQQGNTA